MAWRRSGVRAPSAPLHDNRPRNRAACLLSGAMQPRDSARGGAPGLPGAGRHLAPELLEAVVRARLGGEDVDDDVEVVHEDPARLADALDAAGQQAVALLEPLMDPVVDRLRLALGVARADDEQVRVADD